MKFIAIATLAALPFATQAMDTSAQQEAQAAAVKAQQNMQTTAEKAPQNKAVKIQEVTQ